MSDILDQLRNRIHDSPIPAERLMDAAAAEIEHLRAERDKWHARAFAMFWKLPGDLTVEQLQKDAERAMDFVRPPDGPQ